MPKRDTYLTVGELVSQLKKMPQDLPVSLEEGRAMHAVLESGEVVVAAWCGCYDVEYMKRFSGRGGTPVMVRPST